MRGNSDPSIIPTAPDLLWFTCYQAGVLGAALPISCVQVFAQPCFSLVFPGNRILSLNLPQPKTN